MNKEEEEFEKQVKNSRLKNLKDLNTNPKLEDLKNCYSENFEKIEQFISSSNPKSAIEDINDLCGLPFNRMDSSLMQEINNGIMKNIISKNDLK
jgi:DNA phosphorothioation-dependent restriction protein DptG